MYINTLITIYYRYAHENIITLYLYSYICEPDIIIIIYYTRATDGL